MKKIGLLLLIAISFLQCRKDDSGIELRYLRNFEIAAGMPTLGLYTVAEIEDISSQVQFFLPDGIDTSEVAAIYPKFIRFSTVDGSPLDFMERAYVEITEGNLPELELAYQENIPTNTGSSLDLLPTLIDAKRYLDEGQFDLKIKVDARYSPSQFVEIQMDVFFSVELK